MPFWTYMLHCRGGYFYVGHTDDIEHRIAQHKAGMVAGFTADHQPVEHVWSQDFPTREEAKAAERRIKGWSRVKKLALIRGDWGRISALAKKNDSPSTSSGWSGEGESFASFSLHNPKPDYAELVGPQATAGQPLRFSLQHHPSTPPVDVKAVTAQLRISDGLALLRFDVFPGASLKVPDKAVPDRTDELWQTTCFELFISSEGEGYREFNFSPSTAWAAYRFDAYRNGMNILPLQARPEIQIFEDGHSFTLVTSIDARLLPSGSKFALSAVIEESDGAKSYWALAHPPGKPDFHHPTCFAASLPPPSEA